MYQRDYILRMVEMFGEMLAGIMGFIRKGDYNKASQQIGRVYNDILREDASFFTSIPEHELTHRLMESHNYTNGHLEILAELFNAEAELNLARGDRSESLTFFRKSLLLFEFVDDDQKTYSLERINKIETIRKRIDTLKMQPG
jgi:hypothetical protein